MVGAKKATRCSLPPGTERQSSPREIAIDTRPPVGWATADAGPALQPDAATMTTWMGRPPVRVRTVRMILADPCPFQVQ